MKLHISISRQRQKIALISIPSLLLISIISSVTSIYLQGCGGEDHTYVDFSKRITIEQPADPLSDTPHFRVAVAAMISAKETAVYYHRLLDYISGKLGREIRLIQRKTYGEINELFGRGEIDLAFICAGPYATGKEKYGYEALAIPEVRGNHFYQAYLIVSKDSSFQKLEDLKGKDFAFTDPDSNTGKLVPTYWLQQRGETPKSFFGRTIYTYSHDNSIMAVAMSLVDAAAVHGQIWEFYNIRDPIFTSKTRVIRKSIPYGNPPVVAASRLPHQLKKHIRKLLYSMHADSKGKEILDELMIDRFIRPKEEWYQPILVMKRQM